MFICEKCKRIIGPGISPINKVVETREKIYSYEDIYQNRKISRGREIVKEVKICLECDKEES